MLILRLLLAAGCLFFVLWGGIVFNISLDTVVWNGVFFIINIVQAGIIIWGMRKVTFSPSLEAVYLNLFQHTLSRAEFDLLTKNKAFERTIKKNRAYAEIGDEVTDLAIIVQGTAVVSKKREGSEIVLNTSGTLEFLDSPEFLSQKKEFEVNIRAGNEDLKIVAWPMELLRELLKKNPHINDALTAAISKDIAFKLFRSNDFAELGESKSQEMVSGNGNNYLQSAHPAFNHTMSKRFIREISVPMSSEEKKAVELPVIEIA